MIEPYMETFTNEYGERWWFNYDVENDMGILWGDDFSYKKLYVFDGICIELILNEDEINWLNKVWKKYSNSKDVYLDLNTQVHITNSTYLEDNYCPICLQQKTEFEDHHCIPASEGGSDDVVNILHICNSCHSLITKGCVEDSFLRHMTAIHHQKYLYGINFFKMNPSNNKRYKNRNNYLYKLRPVFKDIINYYENLSNERKEKYNDKIKKDSLYYYKYYRSIVRNVIPSTDIKQQMDLWDNEEENEN